MFQQLSGFLGDWVPRLDFDDYGLWAVPVGSGPSWRGALGRRIDNSGYLVHRINDELFPKSLKKIHANEDFGILKLLNDHDPLAALFVKPNLAKTCELCLDTAVGQLNPHCAM